MDTMEELKKEIEYLREQYYGNRVMRRQAIIQDLIRTGMEADRAIDEARKVCDFIEGVAPVTETAKKPSHLDLALARAKPKKKRKYTKRSKFWNKKK